MEAIRKKIRKILSESIIQQHYQERLYERFLNKEQLTVGYEIPNSVGEYETVGTYIIPHEIKTQILNNAKLVEAYNFPKTKSYGIQISTIPISKDRVQYFSNELREEAKKHVLLFVDEETHSNGNQIFVIVRDNKLITIYMAKNYVSQDPAKLKVDAIIKNMDVIKLNKVR